MVRIWPRSRAAGCQVRPWWFSNLWQKDNLLFKDSNYKYYFCQYNCSLSVKCPPSFKHVLYKFCSVRLEPTESSKQSTADIHILQSFQVHKSLLQKHYLISKHFTYLPAEEMVRMQQQQHSETNRTTTTTHQIVQETTKRQTQPQHSSRSASKSRLMPAW